MGRNVILDIPQIHIEIKHDEKRNGHVRNNDSFQTMLSSEKPSVFIEFQRHGTAFALPVTTSHQTSETFHIFGTDVAISLIVQFQDMSGNIRSAVQLKHSAVVSKNKVVEFLCCGNRIHDWAPFLMRADSKLCQDCSESRPS